MITLVKVNVLTDDEAIPADLRERITSALRQVIVDDPEGQEHAKVSLEWRHTVHNRDYMATLPPTAHVERISLPKEASRTVPRRRDTREAKPSRVATRRV